MNSHERLTTTASLPPRQFTLAGLMSFVVAWSAYFSLLAASVSWLQADLRRGERQFNPWLAGVTVALLWVLFRWLYRRWGLRQALRVHYAGPLIFAALASLMFFGELFTPSGVRSIAEIAVRLMLVLLEAWALGLLYGCYVSMLIGFPVVMLMLWVRREPSAGCRDGNSAAWRSAL
jgi:hypothetical protein